jgi:hypothetical protein
MNVIATIGHNQPPATPFDVVSDKINDLYGEAKNWCDGEDISSAEQADEVQKLLRLIQAAEKEADAARVEENKPFDEGKAAVQAKYAPLIANTKSVKGLTVLAIDACKQALAPWLIKVEEENRRKAEEARREAEAKAEAAREALRQKQSLEDAAHAEQLVREAKAAEVDARKAANAKASAKGEGRAVGLRDRYTPEVTDYTAFARHVWTVHRSDMEDFLNIQAAKLVASGARGTLPGVTIHHERIPV